MHELLVLVLEDGLPGRVEREKMLAARLADFETKGDGLPVYKTVYPETWEEALERAGDNSGG